MQKIKIPDLVFYPDFYECSDEMFVMRLKCSKEFYKNNYEIFEFVFKYLMRSKYCIDTSSGDNKAEIEDYAQSDNSDDWQEISKISAGQNHLEIGTIFPFGELLAVIYSNVALVRYPIEEFFNDRDSIIVASLLIYVWEIETKLGIWVAEEGFTEFCYKMNPSVKGFIEIPMEKIEGLVIINHDQGGTYYRLTTEGNLEAVKIVNKMLRYHYNQKNLDKDTCKETKGKQCYQKDIF